MRSTTPAPRLLVHADADLDSFLATAGGHGPEAEPEPVLLEM